MAICTVQKNCSSLRRGKLSQKIFSKFCARQPRTESEVIQDKQKSESKSEEETFYFICYVPGEKDHGKGHARINGFFNTCVKVFKK